MTIGAAVGIPVDPRQLFGGRVPGRAGVQPALAGSVVLTTVTDVVGFFAFLGLATLVLL
jgi:magnesium transporter